MSKLLTKENLALMLSKARTECNQTQKYMAKALDKSVGTIQNWENGYATPNVIDLMDWFDVLGLNPMRYILDFLYPDIYEKGQIADYNTIEKSLLYYINEIASESEKRKIAYCIFGNTGSSWSAQVDMLTAHNHLNIRQRVNIGQNILDSFEMDMARDQLIHNDCIMPDVENLKHAIQEGKNAAINKKDGYVNQ